MVSTRKLSISLPKEQAGLVQQLIDSGHYASVSAVISDGLRVLQAREAGWNDGSGRK
jgi:putative addiction module CopG family antidote